MLTTIRLACLLLAGWRAALMPAAPASQSQPAPARVAIFNEPGFPYYDVSGMVSPAEIARHLRAAGIAAELLDTSALSDPARFRASAFSALVLPYGNTYPQAALP